MAEMSKINKIKIKINW